MGRKIGMWIYLQRSPDFGFPRIKGPERNSCERSHRRRCILCLQLLRLPDDDSDSKASAVDSRRGLTTAPWPWLAEDLSSCTHSCPGGSTAGSPNGGASSAAACSLLHIISCFLDTCLYPLWAWFQKLVQSRTAHALLELMGRWDKTNRSPDNEHFSFIIIQFPRFELSDFYLPFSFCDFTVFINISDFGCKRSSYFQLFSFY